MIIPIHMNKFLESNLGSHLVRTNPYLPMSHMCACMKHIAYLWMKDEEKIEKGNKIQIFHCPDGLYECKIEEKETYVVELTLREL